MSNPNMRIWDVLGKTDPRHTKKFTRSGGFSGTAVKPMWANKQMTELFGPCGIGWGQTEPQFQVVPALDEILVYCTVGLWYFFEDAKHGPIYGVGGDKVLVKHSKGLQTDDEAFKKAYTDALGNAMKFVGVAADVHMGLFDDNKYVQSMGAEFAEEDKAKEESVRAEVDRQREEAKKLTLPEAAALPSQLPPELEWSFNRASGVCICKILDAKLASKKEKPTENFVIVQLNGKIDESKKDKAYYWHSSNRELLLNNIGKSAKFVVTPKGDFPTIAELLEIEGKKVEVGTMPSFETQARLLASTMDFEEGDLNELHVKLCGGSWMMVLEKLKEEKERRDTLHIA